MLQLEQVIAAANVPAIDEDLRDSHPATRALDHFVLSVAAEIDRNFLELEPLLFQQRFGAIAV
jgi:hypothetical protein